MNKVYAYFICFNPLEMELEIKEYDGIIENENAESYSFIFSSNNDETRINAYKFEFNQNKSIRDLSVDNIYKFEGFFIYDDHEFPSYIKIHKKELKDEINDKIKNQIETILDKYKKVEKIWKEKND